MSESPFVPHPLYGDQPRYTGLEVRNFQDGAYLKHMTEAEVKAWCAQNSFLFPIAPASIGWMIPGTAIAADPSRQRGCPVAYTHYVDVRKACRDCGRVFIFYAEEQRHWYEELQFSLNAGCVRCHPCRKRRQALDAARARYESLIHVPDRTVEQQLVLALARLDLVEAGEFHHRQLEHVRSFLRRHPDLPQSGQIRARLDALPGSSGRPSANAMS
jgi:Probable zinc-ribbon domain